MDKVIKDPYFNCAFREVNGVIMYAPLNTNGTYSQEDADWFEMTNFENDTIGSTFHFDLIKLLLHNKDTS